MTGAKRAMSTLRSHHAARGGLRAARCIVLGLTLALTACNGGSGSGSSSGSAEQEGEQAAPTATDLDKELGTLAQQLGFTGDPATIRGAVQTRPADDALVKLGQLLFFSQTLSANFDISCGTCHHTDFGGSDGLSISVGVAPKNAAAVGPGREVDTLRDADPSADGGPNMHRNSITSFNAALFDRGLMLDSRVFVLDDATVASGQGQLIKTPESGGTHDLQPLSGLLEFTMKGPIVNDNEMRAFAYAQFATPVEYRDHLVRRLRGEVDAQLIPKPDAAVNWLERFRAAFSAPSADAADLITIENVQRALAAFIASQIFVDTPWRDFLGGDHGSLNNDAKEGAKLFLLTKEEGGLGCASCHSGDRFTDERFHNVGFPQIGRGFRRADKSDLGRWLVTGADEDLNAFRTPSLLNLTATAPYGHAGTFATLVEAIQYHADPRREVDSYDFSLLDLPQFRTLNVSYPSAESHTRDAIARSSFSAAEPLLVGRALSDAELRKLLAFLYTLTDRCVRDRACIRQWLPTAEDDPDGHLLVRDESLATPPSSGSDTPESYPNEITMLETYAPNRSTFADVQSCANGLAKANTGQLQFARKDEQLGLVHTHAYDPSIWFAYSRTWVEITMIGGGISSVYLDDDCWPDLAFTGASGTRFYQNESGAFFQPMNALLVAPEARFTGTAVADLDGDYRRELVLGNLTAGDVPVYSQNSSGQYEKVAGLPMKRPTYGISFAPLDGTGRLYAYLAHWAGPSGTNGTSPALWRIDGPSLRPWDEEAGTTSAHVDQAFNFTPKFADFTGDGRIDLVIASDFETSSTLRNLPDSPADGVRFANETNRTVITDENGMGSTLLDIDNDGVLEWFVTSIVDPNDRSPGNWGHTGNRLYRNVSTPDRIAFEDITTEAGVRHGYWGWGACAADFDNSGFVDIFHVNGFGYIPTDVVTTQEQEETQLHYESVTRDFMLDKPSRLFINAGNGTFTEEAVAWAIDAPSEGRGVTCFDYDRDGDIDIAVFNHSSKPQFFENESGHGAGRRFLNVRLVGEQPNTDAIGARVYVTANVGGTAGAQTQLRLAEANSNFNSQNVPDLHFGLGSAAVVDEIEVVWPKGATLTCTNIAVNQFIVLDERDGQAACP